MKKLITLTAYLPSPMQNNPSNTQLSNTQKDLLKSFFTTFLPKRGNRRKNTANELEYVHTTLNRVFIQRFGFNLTRENTLDAFIRLGYEIFTKNGNWYPEVKVYKPSSKGDSTRFGDVYSELNAMFIYIDIDASLVRKLMLTTLSSLPNTSPGKIQATEDLIRRIEIFKQGFKP